MKFFFYLSMMAVVGCLAAALAAGEYNAMAGKDYPIQPVPFTKVHLHDSFWNGRIQTNREVTIPAAFEKCEENGRMSNFEIAAGWKEGKHQGSFPFDDTDLYKILEGSAYCLQIKDDPLLRLYLDELIEKFAAAQEDDGYLYTCRTNDAEQLQNWMGPERWSNLTRSHELYNAGHMYEAAAAHYRATGKRNFLDVALKNADLICKTFGPGKLELPPGHQIVEMGLAQLYRVTGEERYIELAKYFLEQRGIPSNNRKLWGQYNQDHKPVLEQDEAVGHAVRAVYMYAGMADVAALTGDRDYLHAIDRLWDNVVSKKLYITGGIGATGHGEAFGANYELPNMSAYCETCAAIGNVYWNHRLFLLHGHGRYIDVMERTLYNGLISGVSLDGKLFFYPNPLESQGQHKRSPWFGCACCPGNIARFVASVPGYQYAVREDQVYVNLYVAGSAELTTENGTINIKQENRYPWDGLIRLSVLPDEARPLTLRLRIPGWAGNEPVPGDLYRFLTVSDDRATLRVNNQAVPIKFEDGYAVITRTWQPGDSVELMLPMTIRRILAHKKVEADRGKVAIQRGPIVYCAEWPDNPDGHVLNLQLQDDAALYPEHRPDLFDGVVAVKGRSRAYAYADDGETLQSKEQDLTLIPYYAWAHRGSGEMAVWLARELDAVRPLKRPTLASRSKVTTSGGTNPGAFNDQDEPSGSNDQSCTYFHWWPKKGTTEWVQYDFPQTEEVSMVEVYWFDDTGQGQCRLPKSWKILYRVEGEWKPVWVPDEKGYSIEKDTFNKIVFETVRTDALRLEVQLQDEFSAGIHEWKVKYTQRV